MAWWQYLLLVNLYLLLFYGFYSLLLKKETFFQLNRVYLVSAALLAFLIPIINARCIKNLFITQQVKYSLYNSPVIIYKVKPAIENTPVSIGQVLVVLYLGGVIFLAIRFFWQLVQLKRTINGNDSNAPYSFFKKIKLDAGFNGGDVIAVHEQVHAQQWHSADVLIIEAVMILNWFNPVVYFYRRAIKHIHEFIADSYTLRTGTDKADYALLLLSQTFNTPPNHLVSYFFNHSLLKQRIIMLQKNRSQRIKLLKYGLSAPLFILMLILSSATVNSSRAIKKVDHIALWVFETPANTALLSKVNCVTLITKPGSLTAAGEKTKKSNNNIRLYVLKKETIKVNPADTATIKDGPLFTSVEIEPQFAGSFGSFLAKNIQYPADARSQKVQGRVIVNFVVEKDGQLSDIKVLRAPSPSLGYEAARVIALSPKWVPGVQNGHLVRVKYTVPISFALDDDNTHSPDAKPDTAKTPFNLKKVNNTLFIVDGKAVPYNNLGLIDANNIESVNVLKGATATAQYGSKALNGVIVITTKSQPTVKICK